MKFNTLCFIFREINKIFKTYWRMQAILFIQTIQVPEIWQVCIASVPVCKCILSQLIAAFYQKHLSGWHLLWFLALWNSIACPTSSLSNSLKQDSWLVYFLHHCFGMFISVRAWFSIYKVRKKILVTRESVSNDVILLCIILPHWFPGSCTHTHTHLERS